MFQGDFFSFLGMCASTFDRFAFLSFSEPINIFQAMMNSGPDSHHNPPIRLCYHRGVHYNSIIDPHQATIGVGLGNSPLFSDKPTVFFVMGSGGGVGVECSPTELLG